MLLLRLAREQERMIPMEAVPPKGAPRTTVVTSSTYVRKDVYCLGCSDVSLLLHENPPILIGIFVETSLPFACSPHDRSVISHYAPELHSGLLINLDLTSVRLGRSAASDTKPSSFFSVEAATASFSKCLDQATCTCMVPTRIFAPREAGRRD